MKTYKEKMLISLVEKYRKSRKDNGTNIICRRTSISPVELYKKYNKNDGDLEEIEAVNQAAAGMDFLHLRTMVSAVRLQRFT